MGAMIPETADLSSRWCPGCEPSRDPVTEILAVTWCHRHVPHLLGADDAKAGAAPWLSGAADVDGRDCRLMAEVLGRAKGE